MTQQQLATSIGIRFQQVQKYETGANRVSASRLWDISIALGVPIAYFFERFERPDDLGCASDPVGGADTDELIRSVHLMSADDRRRLSDLLRDVGDAA